MTFRICFCDVDFPIVQGLNFCLTAIYWYDRMYRYERAKDLTESMVKH